MTNEKVIMAYIDKVAERTTAEVLKKLAQNTSPRMNDEDSWRDPYLSSFNKASVHLPEGRWKGEGSCTLQ